MTVGAERGREHGPAASETPGSDSGSVLNLSESLSCFGCISCKPQRVGSCPLSIPTIISEVIHLSLFGPTLNVLRVK